MTWPVGTAVQSELDALHAECAALRAERDELLGMREEVLHYQREFHRLRADRDEAVALLRKAPLGQHDRGWWNRIITFLAKLGDKP